MKFVKPLLNRKAGLPSRPKTATADAATGPVQRALARPPNRVARSAPTHASAARHSAKLAEFHRTYGQSRPGRSSSPAPGRAASSASDHIVVCREGYHWFQAIPPSTVGHVVLPTT